MKKQVRFYTLLLFVATSIFCSGQGVYYHQFTEADGLPSMTTYEMFQDSSGLLWIGTENGLVSFDGVEFKSYTHPELKDNDIFELSLSGDGSILFFNLSHQLARVVNGEVEIVLTGKEQRHHVFSSKERNFVLSKFIQASKQCYKLYELNEDTLHLIREKCTNMEDREEVWRNSYSSNYPTNRIFYHKQSGKIEFYDAFDNTFDNIPKGKFKQLLFDGGKIEKKKNNFYFGELGEKTAALIVSDEIFIVDKRLPQLYDVNEIQRVVSFGPNNYVIKNDKLDVFNSKTGKQKTLIEDIVVNTVFEDKEGQLWVSTRSRGLLKINKDDYRILSFKDAEQIITNIQSTENELVLSWDDKIEIRDKWNNEVRKFDLQTNKQSTILALRDSFLIASFNRLFKIESNDLKLLTSNFLNAKSMTHARGKLIAGNYSYLGAYDIDQFDKSAKYLYFTNALTISYFEGEDLLVLGTDKGICSIDSSFNYQEYAPELSSVSVKNIITSGDSVYWVATKNDGLIKIKDEKVLYQFDTSNGLLTNSINDIAIQDDYIYAATTKGISQINMTTNSVVTKNSFNGLPADHVSGLCIFNDSIWLAIQKDVIILDSSFFKKENVSSTLVISDVYCNNEEITFKNGMSFGHNQNKIDIILSHISLSSGNNKSIKYRLANSDTLWTNSQEAAIRLPSLKPGNYNLEIVGINAVGAESEPLKLDFKISFPWWETLTTRISGILLLTAIGYGIILYRGRRIRKEESVKRDFLNQINSIKDQALQLQMNPHFIFNSLNAIQSFIGTNEEEKAMNYLARFARLIRLIFEYSKGNSISLEEELEFIQLYLNLENLRFKDKVNVSLTVDPALEDVKDIIKVPPLLIQPIVENSFKHGLFHKPGKGELKIDYRLMNKVLHVTIEDDGIGRKESKLITKRNLYEHISSGIKTTQERIDLLNFRKKAKHNKMYIIDLYKEDGSSNGTKTIIELSV